MLNYDRDEFDFESCAHDIFGHEHPLGELHRAPLGEALRFVAEAAGYGVVLGEGLERTVTVSLRRVPALEALAAIAEAHRVSLERVGRNVFVRSL